MPHFGVPTMPKENRMEREREGPDANRRSDWGWGEPNGAREVNHGASRAASWVGKTQSNLWDRNVVVAIASNLASSPLRFRSSYYFLFFLSTVSVSQCLANLAPCRGMHIFLENVAFTLQLVYTHLEINMGWILEIFECVYIITQF